MDISRFGDKKTHLTIKILSLTYYFYIFHLTLSNGKLAITHEGDKGEKGEKFTIHEVISTPYRPQIFHVASSHVS